MTVLALDPGKTTGVATWHAGEFFIEQAQYSPLALYNRLWAWSPEVIVYESFVYIPGLGHADLTPVELIGIIKMYHEMFGSDLHSYTPHIGKAFWTDDKIRSIGLWKKGQRHGMDALKHLLKYLTEEEKNPTWLNALKGLV